MLEKDLVYELFKDKDKVCESYIWCVFLEKLNSLNKDSQLEEKRRHLKVILSSSTCAKD